MQRAGEAAGASGAALSAGDDVGDPVGADGEGKRRSDFGRAQNREVAATGGASPGRSLAAPEPSSSSSARPILQEGWDAGSGSLPSCSEHHCAAHSLSCLLRLREVELGTQRSRRLREWSEQVLVENCARIEDDDLAESDNSRLSTISVHCSADGAEFAATHGDHTISVFGYSAAGGGIKTLRKRLAGHPRTPWCVRYHPTRPRLLVSGCLGGWVRVWNTETGETLHSLAASPKPIACVGFAPSGVCAAPLVLFATGRDILCWYYDNVSADVRTLLS